MPTRREVPGTGVGRVGPIDICAQAEVGSALRTDTPLPLSWKVVQVRVTFGEGDFPATTEQTLAASGVYTTRMMWTNYPATVAPPLCEPARPFDAAGDVTGAPSGAALEHESLELA
jgi:hypothetical protein